MRVEQPLPPAARRPARAKALGMRNGSKPCRLRPVGRIAGVRSRSPPGAGRMKRPSSARRMRGQSRDPAPACDRCAARSCRASRIASLPGRQRLRRLPRRRAPRAPHGRDVRHATLRPSPAACRRAARPMAPRRRHAGRAGSACIRVRAPRPSASAIALRRRRPRPARPRRDRARAACAWISVARSRARRRRPAPGRASARARP